MHDPKAQLISYLGANVADAYGSVPQDAPPEFLTVELTGDSDTGYSTSPTFAVQAWSDTDANAGALSLRVMEAMRSYAYEPHVRKCSLNKRYEYPDPETRKPRYQLVYDLVVQD